MGILRGKLPIHTFLRPITFLVPSSGFPPERFYIAKTAIQTLPCQYCEFALGNV